MIAVLATNAYKAASKVRKVAEVYKSLPVASCFLLDVRDGKVTLFPFRFEERAEHAETIPAIVDGEEWATCIPAKPFTDWLRVTQNPKKGQPDRIELTFDPQVQIVRIRAGNTRAEFKCIDAQEFPPC